MTQNVNMDYIGLMFLSLLIISSPSEERKHQSIFPWIFKAAEGLEWVERLKSMLKQGSSTFALNSLHSSPFPPLHCNWPTESWWYIFNTTVSHPQRLQTMAFLTYNGPQSCSLLVSTHTWCHPERSWVWKNMAFCDDLLQRNSTLAQSHSVICTTTLWYT